MKRRDFLKKSAVAGVGVAAAASSLPAPAIAQARKDLVIVST